MPTPPKRPTVRNEDLASWSGTKVIELETHRLWSTRDREVRPLSDGSEMWVYKVCIDKRTNLECRSAATAFGSSAVGATTCRGGDTTTRCCHNQFIVKDATVREYRALGDCATGCSVRPESQVQGCL